MSLGGGRLKRKDRAGHRLRQLLDDLQFEDAQYARGYMMGFNRVTRGNHSEETAQRIASQLCPSGQTGFWDGIRSVVPEGDSDSNRDK